MTMTLTGTVRAAPHGAQRRLHPHRRGKPVRPSKKDELWYKASLLTLTRQVQDQAQAQLLPLLQSLEPLYAKGQDHCVDASQLVGDRAHAPGSAGRIVEDRIAALRGQVGIAGVAQRLAEAATRRVGKSVDERVANSVRQSMGIDISGFLTRNTAMQAVMQAAIKANVGLIKSLPEHYFDKLHDTLTQGVAAGMRCEDMAKEIRRIGDVTDSRAKLIARDQVSKMNGAMTMLRQTSLGIRSYLWQTAGDERVRDVHADLDGKAFAWNDPPAEGNPGQAVCCRCVAVPVPDLDDADGGEVDGAASGLTLGGVVDMGLAAQAIGSYFGQWASAYDGRRVVDAFNPDQPRDERGRWSGGGSGGEIHATLTGKELGQHASTKELRKAAMTHAEQHLIGKTFTNEHTGNAVNVGKSGIKHTLSQSGGELLQSIPAIPKLIAKGRLVQVEADKKGDRNVLSVEKYAANLQLGGKRFRVFLTVKQYLDGRRYYDHGFISTTKRA